MNESGKAVFLSYASQDAEAARKICESLRAAGVEVWFDQSELVGGDAWDQKIRKQIRECALLIPIISQTTQGRREAYFRLEWKLAEERTHLMARGTPFLLPVTIDETSDRNALVPDSFLAVQWTKAPGGEASPAFCQRVKRLLGGEAGRDRPIPPSRETAGSGDPAPQPRQTRWLRPVLASAILVIVVLAITLMKKGAGASATHADASAKPLAAHSNSRPEVEALLQRVRTMTAKTDALRTELDSMESLLGQATKLDSADASVWAAWAMLDCRYVVKNYDLTQGRLDAARSHSAQATGLDPESPEVRLAQAMVMHLLGKDDATNAAATKILQRLLIETPGDGRVLMELGSLAYDGKNPDAALDWYDRAARLPGFAGLAHFTKAKALFHLGRVEPVGPELDRSLEVERSAEVLLWKSYILTVWNGDLAGARQALNEVPPQYFVEDMPAMTRSYIETLSQDYDRALAAVRAVPHDYLQSAAVSGPKGFFAGNILALQGKKEAARLEWQAALATVERRLATESNDRILMEFKALLQADLGDLAAGQKTFQTVKELYGDEDYRMQDFLHLQLLPASEAIAWVEKKLAIGPPDISAAALRLDPVYNPIRSDPGFAALLARAEADPRLSPTATLATSPKTEDGEQRTAHAPDAKSVAVLAFTNLSDDKENEYFSDGISEELLNVLAKVPKLKVAARTSSFYFKGQNVPIPEIAQKLGVAYVVEGSVRKAGNKVRITAQLIKAADGFHVWSETYDRELQDIFAVQDEIAKNILQAVKGNLLGESELPHVTTTKIEAYTLYLEAQGAFAKRGDANLREAIRLFEAALAIDQDYVPALVGLAQASELVPVYANLSGAKSDEMIAAATKAARRALKLDPRNATAHVVIGWAMFQFEWRWSEGVALVLRARELAPNDAWIWNSLGDYLRYVGDDRQSLAAKQRAWELDPLSPVSHWDLAYTYQVVGDYDQTMHWSELAIALAPHNLDSYTPGILIAAQAGRVEKMRQMLAAARREVHENEGMLLLLEARAAIAEKKPDEARRILARVAPLAESGDSTPAYLGYLHLLLGESKEAADWLRRAYARRDGTLVWPECIDFDVIASDPATRPILDQPGLKELYELRQRNARAGLNKL